MVSRLCTVEAGPMFNRGKPISPAEGSEGCVAEGDMMTTIRALQMTLIAHGAFHVGNRRRDHWFSPWSMKKTFVSISSASSLDLW